MKKITRGLIAGGLVLGGLVGLSACASSADRASENISTAAENFEVQRTIVATNGITGQVMLFAEGRCSLETANSFLAGAIELTCKTGPETYYKHYYIKGDQDQMAITQEKPIDVSEYHTRIILKPQNIIPEFDIQLGETE